jgi:hypothetical protein
MRILIFAVLYVATLTSSIFSQTASQYFPQNPGYIWYYESTRLDSNNNPMSGTTTFRVDSFSVVQNYFGLSANYVPGKRNLLSVTQPGPYTDSSFYNFQGSNGYQYTDLTRGLDTITFLDTSGLINLISSFNGWYNTYRFASNIGQEYTIFSKDTTISFQSQSFPLRMTYTGKRLSDENVQTVKGNLSAKKFVLSATLYYLLVFPPLPPIPVEVLSRKDTVWISDGKWMLKEVIASTNVDLTNFGFPVEFFVPGEMIILTNSPVGIINYSSEIPGEYSLEQNYPNPFNPVTKIKYSLPESGFVTLRIYDIMGREVITLIKEAQNAGIYEASFDAADLTSGIYYYILSSGTFTETKKMMLIK